MHGLQLLRATIKGNIDLADAEVISEVKIENSTIEGDLDLTESHWSHRHSLASSTLNGNFKATKMRTESDVILASTHGGDMDLTDARVGANLWMTYCTFGGSVTADSALSWNMLPSMGGLI
jgi:hypothetical protein